MDIVHTIMDKKKILFINEGNHLKTGFSVIGKEILSRLYSTKKYCLAEYMSYVENDDPKNFSVPWKTYSAIPSQNSPLYHLYHQDQAGQFGKTLFEHVLLDFKPDIVIDIRDAWMIEWQNISPFRDKFKWIIMPTVDSAPQQASWLDVYSQADAVLGYCRYSKEVLETESGGKIQVPHIVRAGVNPDIYKPLNKRNCRKELGIPEDCNLILKISRNQSRKLFPNLIEAFSDYLKKYNDKSTYLYLHTSFPDVGFDVGKHIMQSGISHRILLSYRCEACGKFWADFFQTELSTCKHCGNLAAHAPNTAHGISSEDMAKIYNSADLYIQYSIGEGLSVPMVEAKACGIPTFGVDYSAMSEQLEVEGCQKIKVNQYFHEPVIQTEQIRVYPCNQDLIEKIHKFFQSSHEDRKRWGEIARKDAVENYSFDRAAKIFEKVIDEMDTSDTQLNWHYPKPKIPPMRKNLPERCSNRDFVDWCIDNILGEPELKNSYWKLCLIKDLGVGYSSEKGGRRPFNRNDCANMFMNRAKNKAMWEQKRVESLNLNPEEDLIKWKLI